MIKLLPIIFLLIACERPPTQNEIDEAALRQSRNRDQCGKVASSLNALSEFRKENGDWLCFIYKKEYKDNPWIVFYENELRPLNRYLYIKDSYGKATAER